MDFGLFVLHAALGAVIAGHGAQKLFGAFGGHGLEGTAGFFESLGLKPGRLHAVAAGAAELVGGALLALGLLTPVGAALVIAVMVVAISTVHASNGLWNEKGGYELNLLVIIAAVALAGASAGDWALDAALGLGVSGTGWALGALGAGLLGGLAALTTGRRVAAREEQRPRVGAAA